MKAVAGWLNAVMKAVAGWLNAVMKAVGCGWMAKCSYEGCGWMVKCCCRVILNTAMEVVKYCYHGIFRSYNLAREVGVSVGQ